jgi:hypothetical protein
MTSQNSHSELNQAPFKSAQNPKRRGRQLGVAYRMLDVAVPEIGLQLAVVRGADGLIVSRQSAVAILQ